MGSTFAAVAGVFAWVGWFSVAPALGFPSLGPAAMFNRAFAPRADSGYWLGWALLFVGLLVAVLVYVGAVRFGLWRPSLASGLVYGAFCWLIAGAAVMPLLGFVEPFPVPLTGPDQMHGTFMMLHLGPGAPFAALVPWLALGAVLGATADWQPDYNRPAWAALAGLTAAAAVVAVASSSALSVPPFSPGATNGARTLSSGAVAALPEGPMFVSVFRLPQAAGAALGPHAHVPGFACTLRGVETITFADAPTIRVGAGDAGFMGGQQVHTHLNTDDLVPAGAVAVLIVVAAGVVALLGTRRRGSDSRLMVAVLVALVALGAIGTWNPWSNDWLFVAIRPAAARGGPMPLPNASRIVESADLAPLPPGPYVETIEELTVSPGPAMTVQTPGVRLLLVVDGQASIGIAGQSATVHGFQQAVLLQPGSTAHLAAAGDRQARLLQFSVAPSGQ